MSMVCSAYRGDFQTSRLISAFSKRINSLISLNFVGIVFELFGSRKDGNLLILLLTV